MKTWEIIALILTVWHVLGFIVDILVMLREDCFGAHIEPDVLNPLYIYKHSNCNWFGVICLTLLVNLICPLLSICYWFCKLCTVGGR